MDNLPEWALREAERLAYNCAPSEIARALASVAKAERERAQACVEKYLIELGIRETSARIAAAAILSDGGRDG